MGSWVLEEPSCPDGSGLISEGVPHTLPARMRAGIRKLCPEGVIKGRTAAAGGARMAQVPGF